MTGFSSRDIALPGGTLLGGETYRVERVLGRGGFGITYRCVHIALDRPVAIKEFFPEGIAERSVAGPAVYAASSISEYARGLTRFLREAQTLAELDHPNIVRAMDYFKENGTGYLVMEYIGGPTLRDELVKSPGQGLDDGRVREIVGKLVDALDVAHARGILHLDIKSENVVVGNDHRGVILIDFGGSKRLQSGHSTRIFTFAYAPPELLSDAAPIGPESDIFELGVLAHELLTGSLPPDALSRSLYTRWEPQGLPPGWMTLLGAALELDRSKRPQSVGEWWRGAQIATESARQAFLSGPAAHPVPERPALPVQAGSSPGVEAAGRLVHYAAGFIERHRVAREYLTPSQPPGSRFMRAFAFVADVVFMVVIVIFVLFEITIVRWGQPDPSTHWPEPFASLLFVGVCSFVYLFALGLFVDGSLGHFTTGAAIARRAGGRPTVLQHLVRSLVKVLEACGFIFAASLSAPFGWCALLLIVGPLFLPRRLVLHDLVAGTRVVEVDRQAGKQPE